MKGHKLKGFSFNILCEMAGYKKGRLRHSTSDHPKLRETLMKLQDKAVEAIRTYFEKK